MDIFKIQTEYKSNEKSNQFRLIGNDQFRGKNWFDALFNYNKSIAYANSKNEAALGYANRSAAYFEAKLYENCLENIQLARENDYPADKMSKLIEREAKCKELMKQSKAEENWWSFFKLSYPANEKIPWIVDCVEMRWTKKYGRGIYAKQDLKAGDIISIEEPALNFTKKGCGYYHCYNCLKTNAMNLIPCDRTASIMFCSIACKESFYSKAVNMNEIICADAKMLSDVADFFGGVKEFDEYMKRTDLKKLKKTIFDYDFSDPKDPKYKENQVNCLLSLCTNKQSIDQLSIIGKYISKTALHHILSIFALNNKTATLFDGKDKQFNVGHYIPLFASLINHSCIGSAHTFVVDGKVITFMEKPVKAGQQIFDCYPGVGLLLDVSLKKNLEKLHMFKCDCELCVRSGFMNIEEFEDGVFRAFSLDPSPVYEKNFAEIKERLKEAQDEINNNPEDNKIVSKSLIYVVTFMEAIGFQCAYPF